MKSVAAFLEPEHDVFWGRVLAWSREHLGSRPEPMSDDEARAEARVLVGELANGGCFDPIGRQDLRALCLARDAIAAASPLADAIVALQGLGATALLLAGSHAQRAQWVERIVKGEAIAAFALTEPEAGSDAAAVKTTAHRDGDSWMLNGEKHLISNAGIADVYVVFASTRPDQRSRGVTAFLIPGDAPGLHCTSQVMSAAHPLGHMTFTGCRVKSDAVIGEIDQGFKVAMMTLDRLRPSVGAAACGMAARALAEAASHARTRHQFGQRLADFQLVRAQLGQMATELDAARLLVYRAAWEHDRRGERISTSAAMAKSFATEVAQRIVDAAVQIIGGRGVLLGHPVERMYRSIRALRIYEGATDILRLMVGASVVEQGTAD